MTDLEKLSTNANKSVYLLWVDQELWGYVKDEDTAQDFLQRIAEQIIVAYTEKNPTQKLVIEKFPDINMAKVRRVSEGYIYNSIYTMHRVRYEKINKLLPSNDLSTPPSYPPPPPPLPSK